MGDIQTALGQPFNPADAPPDEFELITVGEYVAVITETGFRDTSTGGKMLEVEFKLQTSSFEGRVLTERLNLVNKSEKAVTIAMQTLAKITTAAGMLSVKDSSELIGKRMKIKVDVKPGVGTYIDKLGTEKPSQDQNVIKGFYPLNAAPQAAQAITQPIAQGTPAQGPQDAPPAAEADSRPWA